MENLKKIFGSVDQSMEFIELFNEFHVTTPTTYTPMLFMEQQKKINKLFNYC